MKKIIILSTVLIMAEQGSLLSFSGAFGSYGRLNACRDGNPNRTLRFASSAEKVDSVVSPVEKHSGSVLSDAAKKVADRVSDPLEFMKKHLSSVDKAALESDSKKQKAAENFSKLFVTERIDAAPQNITKKTVQGWSSAKNSSEAIKKRAARAIAKSDGATGTAAAITRPSESLLRSFVAKLPALEKLAVQESADGFKYGSRAYDMLWKYYEPAKQAGLIPDKTIKSSIFQRLLLGTGLLTGGLYTLAKAGEEYNNVEPVLSRDISLLDRLSEQLRRPSVIAALLIAHAVGGLALYKKFFASRPTLAELNKQAGANKQNLISLLRKHGYTQTTVTAADLVNLGVDSRHAQHVVSKLDS